MKQLPGINWIMVDSIKQAGIRSDCSLFLRFSYLGDKILRHFINRYILLLLLLLNPVTAEAQQLRATWIARSSFSSKAALAAVMDSLAANNFNVAYVNVWSRGYPLWKSDVFFAETGVYIDPTYAGRDILAEAVAEGHRVGILVEAWFEYGFVGGWTGNIPAGQKGPIFNIHPDWVAKKNDGTEMDANNFYWMSHTNPAAQNFLLAMVAEVCRRYDIDGIELDRIRYSDLTYGYDDYTVNLYKSEHGGNPPPSATGDTSWIRWRANILNQFIARAYDTVKFINRNINLSNAPGHYSSSAYQAYNNYCQDWVWWVDNGKVDNVQVQMYVSSNFTFSSYCNYVKNKVVNDSKVYPSFAVKPSGSTVSDATLTQFFNTTQNAGYSGNAIWYYDDLVAKFPYIKANHYTSKTNPPFSPAGWRDNKAVTIVSNAADAIKSGTWLTSSLPGYSGSSLYAANSPAASIDYYCTVPIGGYYEVYAYEVISSNRATAAQYTVYHAAGSSAKSVDQTVAANDRWYKLGDFYFNSGRQKVLRVSNTGVASGAYVSADAVMLVMNRSLTSGEPLPVELSSFRLAFENGLPALLWTTATERNNFGWEVERDDASGHGFQKIGFVAGAGNSNREKTYRFYDSSVTRKGRVSYRLKQIDADGGFSYSNMLSADLPGPAAFRLEQNFPNPFNPSTSIRFTLPREARVEMTVINVTGKEVARIADAVFESGVHTVFYDAKNLSTGVYFLRCASGGYSETKKMVVLR